MKKLYFISGILVLIILVNACSQNSQKNQPVSNAALEPAASYGIQKGQIPPDFTIKTIDNQQYTLSDFRKESKPILLYFWASWCPYCSRDFDVVKNVYPKYADKVTFLAIDLDPNEKADLINDYKNRKNLQGMDFAEADVNILSDYGITHTTTKYAIGKNGAILYKGSGVFNEQQWEILLSGLEDS